MYAENCSFHTTANAFCIYSSYCNTFNLKNCTVTSNTGAAVNFLSDAVTGVNTIDGCTITSTNANGIQGTNTPTVSISGNTSVTAGSGKYALSGCKFILSGGTYSGDPAFYLRYSAEIRIAEGYRSEPVKWEGEGLVSIVPDSTTVSFYSEGELYDTYSGPLSTMVFPTAPEHSDGTHEFVCWEDADGNLIFSTGDFVRSYELTAVFNDRTVDVTLHDAVNGDSYETVAFGSVIGSVPGMDRKNNDDLFYQWILSDGTAVNEDSTAKLYAAADIYAEYSEIVYTYGELTAALAAEKHSIIIGADIICTGSVTIDYPCSISGLYDGAEHSLIRADTFDYGDFIEIDDAGSVSIADLVIDGNNIGNGTGVSVSDTPSVVMDRVTVCNHICSSIGGAFYLYGNSDPSTLVLNDCLVSGNKAGSGAAFYINNYHVELRGTTSAEYNESEASPVIGSGSTTSLTMYDASQLAYNTATGGDGGAANLDELHLVMYDDASIHHNQALCVTYSWGTVGGHGGGVYGPGYGFEMYDNASVHDNSAAFSGGGVYMSSTNDTSFQAEMIYDNDAVDAADDIYIPAGSDLFTTQPERLPNSGSSGSHNTVTVEPIPDYHPADLDDDVLVPWLGWFLDDPSSRYTFDDRVEVDPTAASTNRLNLKAIWYGTVLAYDDNLTDGEYQFDQEVYEITSTTDVKDFMFTEPTGKVFIGWNTKADGTGIGYDPSDKIPMDCSKVLYAQYAEPYFYVVHHNIDGNETDVMDTIPMSALGIDGMFDITDQNNVDSLAEYYAGLRMQTIYGGMYTDGQYTEAVSDLCGLELSPRAGDIFYLREVPDYYLRPKSLFNYDNGGTGEVKNYTTDTYLLTDIDKEGVEKCVYNAYGFLVNGTTRLKGTAPTVSSGDSTIGENGKYYLYPTITITYTDRPDSAYAVNNVFPQQVNGYFGCVGMDNDDCKSAYTFIPYFITADNVFVTGVEERSVTALDPTKTNPTVSPKDVASVPVKEPAAPLTAKAFLFVSASAFGITPDGPVVDETETPVIEEIPDDKEPERILISVTMVCRGAVTVYETEPGNLSGILPPAKYGYRFAGWFLDRAFTQPADLTDVQSDITVYPRYISESYFALSCELVGSKSNPNNLRLVCIADTNEYAEYGFEYTINGSTSRYSVSTNGSQPAEAIGTDISLKDFIRNPMIEVRPYYVTTDGTTCFDSKDWYLF